MTEIPDWLRPAIHTGGGESLEKTHLNLGFIPLTDCAPLVIAHEKGHFRKYGLEVSLSRQVSWANIRDKVAAGLLDGAHMLAAMPLATTLGLGEVKQATVTALSLDLNGNAITVSDTLYRRMLEADPEAMAESPVTARALKAVIEADRAAGRERMAFATVFPYSSHNYVLRYWLAAAGIDPDRDLRLVVIPPPYMVANLRSGDIAGYCVGEPWNEHAVAEGLGHVLVTDYEIWNNKPEKVFGVNLEWAERYPKTHQALLMALLESAQWIDQPDNRGEVAAILSNRAYVNAPEDVVKMSMIGSFQYSPDQPPKPLPDFNVFYRSAATFPWRSHALWFLSQMYRWGQLDEAVDVRQVAEAVYRPDLYREAAAALGLPYPTVDYKSEGDHAGAWVLADGTEPIAMGADRFLDKAVFDPNAPFGYLRDGSLHHCRLSLDTLERGQP